MKLFKWSARRSGGRITIHGERRDYFADGSFTPHPVKLTGVDAIMLEGDQLIAVDRNDEEHELAREWGE